MPLTLNSIYHSHLLNCRSTCFYFMMLSQKSQIGCIEIYCLLTSLKLNFFLLVILSNCLSYPTLSLICLQTSLSHLLLQLVILGSSSTPHCLCLTTYLQSLNLVSVIFVILCVFVALLILLLLKQLQHLLFILVLITATHFFLIFLSTCSSKFKVQTSFYIATLTTTNRPAPALHCRQLAGSADVRGVLRRHRQPHVLLASPTSAHKDFDPSRSWYSLTIQLVVG